MTRHAVIDIGTNSVKLLVADVAGARVVPVLEDARQTRLGRGFYQTHRLQPQPIAQTARAARLFAAQARKLGATTLRVIATSAAREARNADELIRAVQRACGVRPEILSGSREAEWAFRGAMTDPRLAREPVLLLDVGGGSTEFILGCGRAIHFRHSYPLGAVRLLEQQPHSDPPRPEELAACRAVLRAFLRERVHPELQPALDRERRRHPQHHAVRLVGVGGTATVLARLEHGLDRSPRETLEGTRLSLRRVRQWSERLWSVSLAQRRRIRGMPPERADVMLTGVLIYEAIMEVFGFRQLRVSTRGLRFAAVLEAAHGALPSASPTVQPASGLTR
ncbi:MAG: Ppx/GppA family phosphatase [Verrucomicrobiae bacterium]|nr:Ppx/GppA family phosphatase [Verrucomicrobiae bacterium]